MKRRELLCWAAALPFATTLAAFGAPQVTAGRYRRHLVLIELKGGNDGLNTLIPGDDPAYTRLRPTLAIDPAQRIPLSQGMALHPALAPLLPLWQAQQLALVQGVSYPQPNLSHFRSIEIWNTASNSQDYLDQGWLTRCFAANPNALSSDGVVIGPGDFGPLCGGARALALNTPEQLQNHLRLAGDTEAATGNQGLDRILAVEAEIREAGSRLAGDIPTTLDFPSTPFGQAMRSTTRILAGGQTSVVKVAHGSFDTHGNQAPTQARLLGELADGLVSLQTALTQLGLWQDTLVLSYAEFGRRPQENGSRGTDHGTVNVHFALGGKVNGGLYGETPSLSQLKDGNLPYVVDFRQLYATVLEHWWQLPSAPILDGRFQPVEFLKA